MLIELRQYMLFEVCQGFILVPSFNLDVLALHATVVNQVIPDVWLFQRLWVTNNHKEVLWSGYGYVKSALIQKETKWLLDHALKVASYAIENDDIFLRALEGVDSVNLKRLMDVTCLVWTEFLHPRVQLSYLGFIWRNYTNFALDILKSALQRALSCNKIDECSCEICFFVVALWLVVINLLGVQYVKENAPVWEDLSQVRDLLWSRSSSNRRMIGNCPAIELLTWIGPN